MSGIGRFQGQRQRLGGYAGYKRFYTEIYLMCSVSLMFGFSWGASTITHSPFLLFEALVFAGHRLSLKYLCFPSIPFCSNIFYLRPFLPTSLAVQPLLFLPQSYSHPLRCFNPLLLSCLSPHYFLHHDTLPPTSLPAAHPENPSFPVHDPPSSSSMTPIYS